MSTIKTINPATEEMLQTYTLMKKAEVSQIIREVHGTQSVWAKTDIATRRNPILNLGRLLREQKNSFAEIITQEMGKPISQAILEIEKSAKLCDYYAESAQKFLEPEIVQTDAEKSYRSFEPLGVIFGIMPWNFPFWQVMRFSVPNLIAGNGVILKHAPNSFGASLVIEKLFIQAGFPQNLFRSLIISTDLAPFIIHHRDIAGVTLTGSNRAGKIVAKNAGEALKKVVLELGGSDPYVILEDADLEQAAAQCVKSRLNNCGQVCIAAKRIIVVDKIRSNFEALIIEETKKYQMGDPQDPNTNLGPMARKDLRATLNEQVQRSIKQGAHCILGGRIPKRKGFYYPPTILLNITENSPSFQEELFGPVICLSAARDENDALELANNSNFGLAGAIFTRDLEKGERLAREVIQAGTCAVNSLVSSDPRLPFGGIKDSGFGRELSREGLREFMNIKTIIIKK